MRVHFIFGKGVDGCGVTRGCQLFEKWLVSQGHETHVLDFDNNQTFARGAVSQFEGERTVVGKKESEVSDEVVAEVNKADVVIFHSYPTRKQFAFVERFRRFVYKIDGPVVVMHDHGVSASTINAIPQAGEIFSRADVLVAQSEGGATASAFGDFDPGLQGRIIENPIWLDTTELDEYDLPFDERRLMLNYTGRSSPIKQVGFLPQVVERLLNEGWRGEVVGAEPSINAICDDGRGEAIYQPCYRHLIQMWAIGKKGIGVIPPSRVKQGFLSADVVDPPIVAQNIYAHAEGMTKLGSSMASWAGYRLTDASEYGVRMEYTQVEAFLLTVPIINTHFADNALSPEGKTWGSYDCALTGALGESERVADDLLRLADNEAEWTERHRACRELICRFNDISQLAPKFLDTIMEIGKRPKADIVDLVTWWPDFQAERDSGSIVMTSANAVSKKRKLILEGRKQTALK